MFFKPGFEILPGYTLVKKLGEGAFGTVWEAQGPGVKQALKLMDIKNKSRTGVREYRGIQSVKDIRNAHLVPIHGIWLLDESDQIMDEDSIRQFEEDTDPNRTSAYDRSEEDTLCVPRETLMRTPSLLIVAMSLCDESLQQRVEECKNTGIPLEELMPYMEQAARGIDYLNEGDPETHRNGIQHCDIKPENMMLVGGTVQICDFGIAKEMKQDVELQKTQTLGTPYYMSPEMIKENMPSEFSDQYSLACSYICLRTGRSLFRLDSSLLDVLNTHTEGSFDLTILKGRQERSVVRKAMSLEPTKRYCSNLEFVKALRAGIEKDQAAARVLRKRAASWGMGMLILGAAAVIGYVAFINRPEPPPVNPAGQQNPPPVTVKAPLEEIERDSQRWLDRDEWQMAIDEWRDHVDDYPAEAKQNILTILTDLVTASESGLVSATEPGSLDRALERLAVIFDERNSEEADEGDLHRRARLVQLRILGRQAVGDNDSVKWEQLRQQLAADEVLSDLQLLSDTDQNVVAALRLLAVGYEAPASILEDQDVRKVARQLRDESQALPADKAAWELIQIVNLKMAVLKVAAEREMPGDLSDIFLRESVTLLENLVGIERFLNALGAPADNGGADFQTQRDRLSTIEGTQFQSAAPRLKVLLELNDPASNFGVELVRVTKTLVRESPIRSALLERTLYEAQQGKLSSGQLDQVRVLIDEATVAPELVAATILQRLHSDEFDFSGTLQLVSGVNSWTGLPQAAQQVIAACRAECEIELDEPLSDAEELAGWAKQEIAADGIIEDYLRFVQARLLDRSNDFTEAFVRLQALAANERSFMAVERRRLFATELSVQRARSLRASNNDNQIETDVYSKSEAVQAYRFLRQAMQQFNPPSSAKQLRYDLARELALASFYSSEVSSEEVLNLISIVAGPLSSDVGSGANAQLLAARARSLLKLDDASRLSETLDAVEDLLRWRRAHKRGIGDNWSFYQRIIQPTVDAATSAYASAFPQWQEVGTSEEPVILALKEDVPQEFRGSLATIFATSAKLVDDPSVGRQLYSKRSERLRHQFVHYRLAGLLVPKQLSYIIPQYRALSIWEFSPTVKAREITRLAVEAMATDESNAAANGIQGESLLRRSRIQTSTQVRRDMLDQSIDHLKTAIRSNMPSDRAHFFLLRSAANVDMAYLHPLDKEIKRARLEEALKDAEAATMIADREYPEDALISWGNAAEDMAHYVNEDPIYYFQLSLDKFQQAIEEAALGGDASIPTLNSGRCRLRRVLYLDRQLNQSYNLDLAAELALANRELSEAAANSESNTKRAEANFFLSWTLDEQAKKSGADKFRQEADRAFAQAVREADKSQWAQLQHAWAYRALRRTDYQEADQRARKLLAEKREGEKYVVHWKYIYEAIRIMLLATEFPQRRELLNELVDIFPKDDELAETHRIRLELFFAAQCNDDRDPLLKKHLQGKQWSESELVGFETAATTALSEAQTLQNAELETHATGVLALLGMFRLNSAGGLANSVAQMETFLTLVNSHGSPAGFGRRNESRIVQMYGQAQLRLSGLETDEAKKQAIRKRAKSILRNYLLREDVLDRRRIERLEAQFE